MHFSNLIIFFRDTFPLRTIKVKSLIYYNLALLRVIFPVQVWRKKLVLNVWQFSNWWSTQSQNPFKAIFKLQVTKENLEPDVPVLEELFYGLAWTNKNPKDLKFHPKPYQSEGSKDMSSALNHDKSLYRAGKVTRCTVHSALPKHTGGQMFFS